MALPRRLWWTALAVAGGCVTAEEAPRVDLPVVVDTSGVTPATTDLGYLVTLTEARLALRDLRFTTAGEVHTASWSVPWLGSVAYAHPGHDQAGETLGELPGTYVVDWVHGEGQALGTATLVAGDYTAVDFGFDLVDASAGTAATELAGHTVWLEGTAERSGQAIRFTAAVDAPADRELVGAPFVATVTGDTVGRIALRLHTVDPIEGDTLFDGVDFAAVDTDADGMVALAADVPASDDAVNLLRRALLSHDHYDAELQE